MAILEQYRQFGGAHPVTATLTNVLAAEGLLAPHTGRPFSEAMILGVGGGLGLGYILWEFKAHATASLVLGFRNRWNYPVEYLTQACARLGIRPEFHETGGRKTAAATLADLLAAGRPCLLWVDKAHLPYLYLPASLQGYVSHVIGVCGDDPQVDTILVDDQSGRPFAIPAPTLADARARIGSDKHRLLAVRLPEGPIDLAEAIRAGIADCVEHLGRTSESFALPVITRWARLMTDRKNKKGWPVVFKERIGLYSTLRSIYEAIELDGTAGGALRSLYADFLEEAAPVVGNARLAGVADCYRAAALAWTDLARAALPEDIPALDDARRLMAGRYDALCRCDLEFVADLSARMEAEQAAYDTAFPADDARVEALFGDLQAKLEAVDAAERAAHAALAAAL